MAWWRMNWGNNNEWTSKRIHVTNHLITLVAVDVEGGRFFNLKNQSRIHSVPQILSITIAAVMKKHCFPPDDTFSTAPCLQYLGENTLEANKKLIRCKAEVEAKESPGLKDVCGSIVLCEPCKPLNLVKTTFSVPKNIPRDPPKPHNQ